MQYTPSQIKEKLLEGIDSENNVVDLQKVLEVISILEKYPITREILEETRIGRLVNDVRRKTTDKQLSKRAKELVRSWQKVVSGHSETNSSVNGEGLNKGSVVGKLQAPNKPPISPAASQLSRTSSSSVVNRLISPNSVKSSLSQGQISSKPSTPSLPNTNSSKTVLQQAAKRCNSSPQLSSSAKRFCISPSAVGSQPGTPDSVCSQSSRASSSYIASDKPQNPSSSSKLVSSAAESSVLKRTHSSENFKKKPPDSELRTVQSTSCLPSTGKTYSGPNGMVVSRVQQNGEEISTPTHSIETKGLKTTIRFNKTSPPIPPNGVVDTPKKRGRGRPPKLKPQIPGDHAKPENGSVHTAKGFSEKRQVKLGIRTDIDTPVRAVSITPKVKSTAELIQQLQAKDKLSVGRDTVRQIQDNLIQKEADDDTYHSIVPEGAKPRQHRRRSARNDLIPPNTPVSKTEMVEKFLESSVSQSVPEDLSPLKYELPRTESPSVSTSFEDNVDGLDTVKGGNFKESSTTPSVDSKSVISEHVHDGETKAKSEPVPGTSGVGSKSLTLEEIYSKYPPLDLENFVLDDDTYEMPEPVEITDDDVTRLHSQHWTGMNGCFDSMGKFRDWSQTLSLLSYNSDPLHILPYVVTDD